jgi:threonine synthase
MKNNFIKSSYLMDPHTAVASEAVDRLEEKLSGKTIILSTAHPAKFPKVIQEADLTLTDIPSNLSDIFKKEEKSFNFSASKDIIFEFITSNNQ